MHSNRNSSTSKIQQSLLCLVKNSIDISIRAQGAVIWGGIAMNVARIDLFKPYGLLAVTRGALNLFRKDTRPRRNSGDEVRECSANYGIILKIFGLLKDSAIFTGTWFVSGTVASEIFIAASMTTLLLVAGKGIYKKLQTGELTTEEKAQITLDCLSALGTLSILINPTKGFEIGKAIVEAGAGKVSTYYKVTSATTTAIDSLAGLLDLYKVGKSVVTLKNACQSRGEISEQAEDGQPYAPIPAAPRS